MTDLSSLQAVAVAAVAQGTEIIRSQQPGVVTSKGDRDVASEVDFAVENSLREFLAKETPEIGFLGEEGGRTAGESAASDRVWVLDPIDGTANFVRGMPICAVSLALVEENQPIVGVIAMPFLRALYSAARGNGATCNDDPIHCSDRALLEDAIIAIGDYAVGTEASAKNTIRLALTASLAVKVHRIRMFGTAATDLAWVAAGSLDASVMFSNKPWDTGAGTVIAREAGALVLDIDGSEHTTNSSGTVAVPPALADDLLSLVRDAQPD